MKDVIYWLISFISTDSMSMKEYFMSLKPVKLTTLIQEKKYQFFAVSTIQERRNHEVVKQTQTTICNKYSSVKKFFHNLNWFY